MKKMVFSIAASAALLYSFTICAAGTPDQTTSDITNTPYSFAGPYVGASVGVVNMSNRSQYIATTDSSEDLSHSGTDKITGMLFGGYGWMLNHYYLGGELFARLPTRSATAFNTNDPAFGVVSFDLVKDQYSYGGAAKGGYQVGNMLAYALLGPDVTKFESVYIRSSGESKCYDTKIGLLTGVGLAAALTPHLLLSTEYTYSFYKPIRHDLSDATTKATPRRARFWVSLAYLFN